MREKILVGLTTKLARCSALQKNTGFRPLGWGGGGGGILSYMRYKGVCGPKGYGFELFCSVNWVWIFHYSLDLEMFLRKRHFFIIIEEKINKSPSEIINNFNNWFEVGNVLKRRSGTGF